MKIDFFDPINGNNVSDAIQLGVVEIEDGISEMITFHTHLYLIFDTQILKLESINQYSKLAISFVKEMKFDFDIEEDMIPVKNSVIEIILNDNMADNRIESIDIYNPLLKGELFICDALSFHLLCKQELFFDPSFFF